MDHRIRRTKAVFTQLIGPLPLLAALGACAGAITQDPPEPVSGPDASTDAPVDPAPDAASDAAVHTYDGPIGRACMADTECGDGFRCQVTVPGGYCVVNCSADMPCPEGTVCSPLPYSRISGVCMLPCSTKADCRAEYVCEIVELFPGDPNAPKSPVPVCWEPEKSP
jgi:hypothetical protein